MITRIICAGGILCAILMFVFMTGCSITEMRKQMVGMSLSDIKKPGIKTEKIFDKEAAQVYKDVTDKLPDVANTIVTTDDMRMYIVAIGFDGSYKSCIDTTEVGILVEPVEGNKAKLTVSSGNNELAAFVLEKLSSRILGEDKESPQAQADQPKVI